MDINFHYFTVKTLALKAGFSDQDAQTIAEFSQYVDDFDWITTVKCDNIPQFIINDTDCDLIEKGVLTNLNPTMTGFIGLVDMTYISKARGQKFTVSPFHFIPHTKADVDNPDFETTPAVIGDDSIISELLEEAKTTLSGNEPRYVSLMRIGMYLHIFADTYAHQKFSGYHSNAINNVQVTKIIDNESNKDITSEFWNKIGSNFTPSIGHGCAGHVPDLTYVNFSMKNKATNEQYTRSNTDEFLTAAQHIYNYLRNGLGDNAASDNWDDLSAKISKVFLKKYDPDSIDTMRNNWIGEFSDIKYQYDKNEIENRFKHSKYNYEDVFYRYNYIANKVLIKLYGSKPRGK